MAQFQSGAIVPFHFESGIVTAAVLVSFVGAVTTVELLHRRNPGQGWTNWLQLGSCAGTMGIVAIWCSDRAIVLGDGAWDLQPVYDPVRNALSGLIPVVSFFVAFIIADRAYRMRKNVLPSLVAAGMVMGLPTVGMHYLGDCGISNYHVSFDTSYIVGAIVLAIVACISALTFLFTIQESWLNKLSSRILCATLIAGAASGVHFEASVGTTYTLRDGTAKSLGSGDTNIIIAILLSLCTIPICIGIAVSANRRHRQLADRAQEVILACATFDHDGRLMVTHEGYLPVQKITAKHNQSSFEAEFNTSHASFQWIYRVSNNWDSVLRWVPQMRKYLKHVVWMREEPLGLLKTEGPSIELVLSPDVADAEYSMIFRASFCVAAGNLAQLLGCPLKELGILYERVLVTGSLDETSKWQLLSTDKKIRRPSSCSRSGNDESLGTDCIGKGQLLLLVRKMGKTDVSHLMDKGYHFATIDKIGEQLARGMQVSPSYLTRNLEAVKAKILRQPVPALSGTLLGCFALRAGVSRKQWEVLVEKDLTSRLPHVHLSSASFDTETWALVAEFDGLSAAACLARLHEKLQCPDELELPFLTVFKSRIVHLSKVVSEPFFRNAIFSSSPVKITSYDSGLGRSLDCELLPFYIIPDVHESALKSSNELMYTPLSFFKCAQQLLAGAAYRTCFERRVHQELASFFLEQEFINDRHTVARKLSVSAKSAASKISGCLYEVSKTSFKRSGLTGWGPFMFKDHTEDGEPLEQEPLHGKGDDVRFGGIMVTADVTVEMTEAPSSAYESSSDECAVGTCSRAELAEEDFSTYVDELFEITAAKWRKR